MKNDPIFLTVTNPPAIIRYHDCSGYEDVISQYDQLLPKTPMEKVVDYMSKRIEEIDSARSDFRKRYPNLFNN